MGMANYREYRRPRGEEAGNEIVNSKMNNNLSSERENTKPRKGIFIIP